MSGGLRELKNKGKVQLGNPKSAHGHLWELFVTKFKSQIKRGFTEVVTTRAGRLPQWSQGELRLYVLHNPIIRLLIPSPPWYESQQWWLYSRTVYGRHWVALVFKIANWKCIKIVFNKETYVSNFSTLSLNFVSNCRLVLLNVLMLTESFSLYPPLKSLWILVSCFISLHVKHIFWHR